MFSLQTILWFQFSPGHPSSYLILTSCLCDLWGTIYKFQQFWYERTHLKMPSPAWTIFCRGIYGNLHIACNAAIDMINLIPAMSWYGVVVALSSCTRGFYHSTIDFTDVSDTAVATVICYIAVVIITPVVLFTHTHYRHYHYQQCYYHPSLLMLLSQLCNEYTYYIWASTTCSVCNSQK